METTIPKTNKNCVIQCRVSTNKQLQQGESLEVQEKILRQFAYARGWNIMPNGKVWKTGISGQKINRDDFEEILAYIKVHPGVVDYYVFRSIDRATRAGTEEYGRMKKELRKCGVEMVDTYGIIQPVINTLADLDFAYSWSDFYPSEVTEGVFATTAKQEVTTILTRLVGQEIRLTQQGYRARRPADGYINNKIFVQGKKKTIQVPDPQRAKFRIAMFELRAQGLSDTDIIDRINAMGYHSPIQNKWSKDHTKIIGQTGNRPLSIKQLQHDIQNTIYAGVICEKWTYYKPVRAQYAGLVSIEIWNQANRNKIILKENIDGSIELIKNAVSKTGKFRNKNNPLFPLKFILCPFCNNTFRGSESKGKGKNKVPYYHCTKLPKHKYFGVPKADFEKNVSKYIQSLKFNSDMLNALEVTFMTKYRQRETEIVQASGHIHQNIADLESEQAMKLEAYTAAIKSPVIREKLEHEIEDLEVKIKAATGHRDTIQISRDDIKTFMQEAKLIMEHPSEILLNQKEIRVQKELFGLVFDRIPNYEEILSGTPKLSLAFKLSDAFIPTKNSLVGYLVTTGKLWSLIFTTILYKIHQ